MKDDLRVLLERAAEAAPQADLVTSAVQGARRRRRRRGVVTVAAVLTAGLIGAVAAGRLAPERPDAAAPPAPSLVDPRPANQDLLSSIAGSGIAYDYEPLGPPEEVLDDANGREAAVLVGTISDVDLLGGSGRVSAVRLDVDVEKRLPSGAQPEQVSFDLAVGGAFGVSEVALKEAGGPILLVLVDMPTLLPEADEAMRVFPTVDGVWLEVPSGLGGPYVDYRDLVEGWPAASTVGELADALTTVSPPSDEPSSNPEQSSVTEEDEAALSADERDVLRAVLEAATDPASAALLPASEQGIDLALGTEIVATRTPTELTTADAWRLEHPQGFFRGRSGSLSALEILSDGSAGLSDEQYDFDLAAGSHPRCVGGLADLPDSVAGLRHLSIQPALDSDSSCLEWFSIDVFLDVDGAIHTISLDLWDP